MDFLSDWSISNCAGLMYEWKLSQNQPSMYGMVRIGGGRRVKRKLLPGLNSTTPNTRILFLRVPSMLSTRGWITFEIQSVSPTFFTVIRFPEFLASVYHAIKISGVQSPLSRVRRTYEYPFSLYSGDDLITPVYTPPTRPPWYNNRRRPEDSDDDDGAAGGGGGCDDDDDDECAEGSGGGQGERKEYFYRRTFLTLHTISTISTISTSLNSNPGLKPILLRLQPH